MPRPLRRALHGRVLMPLAYLLLRDRRYALLDSALERDSWSPALVAAHQNERLARLLRVAAAHSPFWQERFARYGVRPRASDPRAELAKLPILTKDELRANWQRMRTTHLPTRQVAVITSGGSTGMPVHCAQSRAYLHLHAAMEIRMRHWMGLRPGDPFVVVQAQRAHVGTRQRFLRRLRLLIERGRVLDACSFDPQTAGPELRRAAAFGPAHVYGFATVMGTVARLSRRHGVAWPTVRAVSTSSEQLLPEDRAALAEAFAAPVFDRYGSREVLSIAMQCPHGGHHILADCNIVEFAPLEEAGSDLQALVLTPLDNEALPLLRYRNGDEAAPRAGPCPCGRTLPLMTGCRGRLCNNVITPDGRIVTGTYFRHYFLHAEGIRLYRFHQPTPGRLDVYVVPDNHDGQRRRTFLDQMVRRIEHDYPGQFAVSVHEVDEIPRTRGGKHMQVVSDVLLHL